MNSKHKRAMASIFSKPIDEKIEWRSIEALFVSLGCRIIEGPGSSVTFEKNGIRAYFHRSHPDKATLRYCVKDARKFLELLGETV